MVDRPDQLNYLELRHGFHLPPKSVTCWPSLYLGLWLCLLSNARPPAPSEPIWGFYLISIALVHVVEA
jgi:hypothetical protein